MAPETVGQRAYDAYRESTGGRTYSGGEMPQWTDLPHAVRYAWECAGAQVRRHTLAEIIEMLKGEQS